MNIKEAMFYEQLKGNKVRRFLRKRLKIPIPKEMLEEIKEVAEAVRKRSIPKLRKI